MRGVDDGRWRAWRVSGLNGPAQRIRERSGSLEGNRGLKDEVEVTYAECRQISFGFRGLFRVIRHKTDVSWVLIGTDVRVECGAS